MNILVIEDNPERIKWFRTQFNPSDQVWFSIDSKSAIKLISEVDFDLIFFDHDLGGEQNVNSSNENTGYQVAKYMREKNYNMTAKVIIHSLNRYGALNIKSLIPSSKICPFSLLKHIFDINKENFGIDVVSSILPISLRKKNA